MAVGFIERLIMGWRNLELKLVSYLYSSLGQHFLGENFEVFYKILLVTWLVFFIVTAGRIVWLRGKTGRGKIDGEKVTKLLGLGLMAVIVSYGVSQIVQILIPLPRPFVVLKVKPLISHEADASFPSDHAVVVFALQTWLSMSFRGEVCFDKVLWLLSWILGVLVVVLRVVAGIHYLVDVAAGAVLGTFVTMLICGVLFGGVLQDKIDNTAL